MSLVPRKRAEEEEKRRYRKRDEGRDMRGVKKEERRNVGWNKFSLKASMKGRKRRRKNEGKKMKKKVKI